jgi:hypothetical protein
MNSLFIGVITGAFGMAYFVYGKRQTLFVPMFSGILLCIYPYFIENIFWLSAVGIALVAAPFVLKH